MHRTMTLTPAVALTLALGLGAQTWTEAGDAGDLPATAQAAGGSGALNQIDGSLDTGTDVDLYLVTVDDPASFTCSSVGGATFDTQLFLFDVNGFGISFKDDDAGSLQSTLTGQFLAGPGLVLIAISKYSNDAEDVNNDELWLDGPFATERQPDGPGAANAIDHWDGAASGSAGSYSLFLTGASFVQLSCSDLAVGGTGAPGTAISFDLNGAAASTIAFAVVGESTGTTSIPFGGWGTLELGLAFPFTPLFLGFTDANGDASQSINVPPGFGGLLSLYAQAFSIDADIQVGGGPPQITLDFCTSDVEAFTVGQ